MTKIELKSDHEIKEFQIEDLRGNNISIVNGFAECSYDWHLLKIPYRGVPLEISDILINYVSVGYTIYTGWVENQKGEYFQPATALWEPGNFYFWFHPNIGYMVSQIYMQIRNGDFGTNLFEKYFFTVDRPIEIPDRYPLSVRSFFDHGAGPRWWHDDKIPCPYKILDDPYFDTMHGEVENFLAHMNTPLYEKNYYPDHSSGWTVNTWTGICGCDDGSVFSSYSAEDFGGFAKYFKRIGWNHILTAGESILAPYGYVNVHIDDYGNSENRKHISPRSKLYTTYQNAENCLFKLAYVGCIPIEKPLLINVNQYAHAVVNLSDQPRYSIAAYGTFDKLDI